MESLLDTPWSPWQPVVLPVAVKRHPPTVLEKPLIPSREMMPVRAKEWSTGGSGERSRAEVCAVLWQRVRHSELPTELYGPAWKVVLRASCLAPVHPSAAVFLPWMFGFCGSPGVVPCATKSTFLWHSTQSST